MPMSLHQDEHFLAAVAAALGETIALVRRRGFHLEQPYSDEDRGPARSCSLRGADDDDDDDDGLDLAAHGIDWDAADERRLHRRSRRRLTTRRRRKAA
jgi:hypothetical protein